VTREVIFSQIQRPSKWKDKLIYVLERLIGLGASCHTYRCLADMVITEKFDSLIHSKVLSLIIWECVDCHMKELWICIEDKWAEV